MLRIRVDVEVEVEEEEKEKGRVVSKMGRKERKRKEQ